MTKDASHPSYGSFGSAVDDASVGYEMKSEMTGGDFGDGSGHDDNGVHDDHPVMKSWYQPLHHTTESSQSTHPERPSSSSTSNEGAGSLATALALTSSPEESRRASLSLQAYSGDVASRMRDSLTPTDSLPPTREGTRVRGVGSSKASIKVVGTYHNTQQH